MKLLLFVGLAAAPLLIAGPAPSHFEALHNTSKLNRFSSTNEIVQYFQTNSLSFETLPLTRHSDRYFWVASYPYSGLDTIDLYCFRGGPGSWQIQMLYFVVKPKDRHINVEEQDRQFVVKNGDTQLLTFEILPEAAR